ncbi:probable disease resistance RPP8-like protein 4 [Magnolia sinica]|uniref:probable disease resistance RPP8-like protein 4 n=1 Tax=Magnolia sinica TaxID=86752 RepID=UPI00265A7DA9|nr:probable disease resistance RPP8-like protein 4 [Magnolia sinica]
MAVEAAVSLVLGKLSDFLVQEAVSLYQVRDQVESVERELRRMRCFLKDADAKQSGDERVKNWVADVRDVAYDAEDIVDTFILRIEQKRRSGFVGSLKRCMFINVELSARHEISNGIERIKNKIQEISASTERYGIKDISRVEEGSSSRGESLREQRQTSPLFGETEVVGFEEDIKALVGRLIDVDLRRCVVSVVGMGGLGKTTLAIKVYNNDAVKKHFDCCAWIFVSEEYVVKDLLQKLIKDFMTLSKEELDMVEKMNAVQLREKLSNHLKEKRYLLVLDDIWKTEAWGSLVAAFPDTNNGSRVLLTTRNREVASYADARSSPLELKLLGDEDAWKLFCKKAFLEQGIHYPQNLEKIGRMIVEKCGGLPLAIVVIGSLLSRKPMNSNEWEKVQKRISSQLVGDESPIRRILDLSYEDLPYRLKPLFLYLGVFPEDHEISAKKLIHLWTAEGFVEATGEETVEEAAEFCMEELIHRSLIQVSKSNSVGGIKSCRIHDLLRELSISKAKEDKFLDVHQEHTNPLSPSKARRLAIHQAPSKYTCLNRTNSHLRSLLWIDLTEGEVEKKQEQFLFRGFSLLRVLDISYMRMRKLPKEIGTLIHLRYLGFCLTGVDSLSLPSSMSNLHNLETLYVKSSIQPFYIPTFIWKMQQLRHVNVWSKIVGRPSLGLDSLVNLQTLKHVNAGDWIGDCLEKLTNLKKLGIGGIHRRRHAEGLSNSLPRLDRLQSLWLAWYSTIPVFMPISHNLRLKKMYLMGKLEKLPESNEFSPNLTKLTLEDSELMEDPMATLEKLPNLRILRFHDYSYVGKEMVCSAQGFPQLESLHVTGLPELEEWRVEEGAMPMLLHLLIGGCYHLKMLPEGLQHVTTLKKLEMLYTRNEFKARMQENGGEDWHKIQHIPSIEIN